MLAASLHAWVLTTKVASELYLSPVTRLHASACTRALCRAQMAPVRTCQDRASGTSWTGHADLSVQLVCLSLRSSRAGGRRLHTLHHQLPPVRHSSIAAQQV